MNFEFSELLTFLPISTNGWNDSPTVLAWLCILDQPLYGAQDLGETAAGPFGWDIYGILMGFQWDSNGILMAF